MASVNIYIQLAIHINKATWLLYVDYCYVFWSGFVLGSEFTPPKKIQEAAVVNPNVTAYSINQFADVLKGNEEEIRWLSKMRHENIITLFGVSYGNTLGDTLPLLVMEGVQCDLFYYLNNTEIISWHDDLMILQGICSGLAYLHMGKSIIHNNISKHTILLTKNVVVKISNFECAVKIHENVNKAICYSSDLFSLGEVISVILSLKYCGTLTADEESIKQLMLTVFNMCTNMQSKGNITSYDILKALKDYNR